ncbi:hypothetical protein ABH922_001784 [Rhodococcus sp. 27YEA15]|uniref:hypothetical protein n=1 Tax=Rhodococcus sp. 27YEA15 TaxID=3156259 RepID=UPI003C7AC8D1
MYKERDCPVAVVRRGPSAPVVAGAWCREHLGPGQEVTVWVPTKRNLRENKELAAFIERYRLEVITGRGFSTPSTPGPLIMAWANPNEVEKALEYASGVTALCVIVGNPDLARPWAESVGAEVVGTSPWIDGGGA